MPGAIAEAERIVVEPSDSPILSGGQPGPHKIQGIGAGFIPDILNTGIIDEILTVTNEEAFDIAKKAVADAGLLLGISSGAALHAFREVASRPEANGNNPAQLRRALPVYGPLRSFTRRRLVSANLT